ncbi:non-specific serine/threonine protein kinase [Nocardioides ginsengisegetis]|uniref:Non-specific serine/threonine protein kinase n=1 Tax=Nocardioides ginsengisegetis TaxID=661491 RepID=A0A7W3J287_9ACTN|nr:LuxR C-terminal-related transcriptional regulator [Nocardioides ginsengisegetis]MBA8804968.1 non-specific serine/threonine protein kinase [Nocardioides ginsengisegetis]
MEGSTFETTRFVGRRAELQALRKLLGESRLLTLTGPAGAGKTRLASEAVGMLSRQFGRRVWFVSLAELQDESLLAHTVAAAMDLQLGSQRSAPAAMADFIGDREALLALDNCEHLVDVVANLVAELLRSCPRLRIITTSIVPLEVAGETILSVPALSVPDERALRSPEGLSRYDAVGLFLDRATAAMPSFSLTTDNAEAVARLCMALEGSPLAVEIAAARIRTLTPQAMLDRLEDRFALLSKGYAAAPDRHRSLLAAVEWTFDLCTRQEQELWLRASVFAGGLDLAAVEGACCGEGLDEREILDVLAGLVNRSVLLRDPRGTEDRYRMLETIRSFGLRRLDAQERTDYWRQRHLTWCATLVDDFYGRWFGPEQPTLLERIRREIPNLRAAFLDAAQTDDAPGTGLRMLYQLEPYWTAHGQLSEAGHWAQALLAKPGGTPDERARALLLGAWAAAVRVDLPAAQQMLDEAAALIDDTVEPTTLGMLQLHRAMVDRWRGDRDAAIRQLPAATRTLADARSGYEAAAHLLLGFTVAEKGELDEAAAAHQRCLDVLAGTGELYQTSYALVGLGYVAGQRGDLATSTEHLESAVRMKASLRDYVGLGVAIETLGWLASAQGNAERSATLMGAAAGLNKVTGMSMTTDPATTAFHDAWSSHATDLIGEERFEAAFRRGMDMPPGEAVAYALGEPAPVPAVARRSQSESPLTPREREVAGLVAQGASNRDIAARLVISERTAETHVDHILRKLGFNRRTQVAAWVTEGGIRSDGGDLSDEGSGH